MEGERGREKEREGERGREGERENQEVEETAPKYFILNQFYFFIIVFLN